ncbi:CoA protein activase [Clostridiisalibacter paucivorans]|uniref:CoA protein activase n=1 Tax=Clostridiisalibacter paucivorans TaxID=408753 RepID=UPI00047ED717|nr:CoA protein activase [Clostridiisalibacter paucivorans]
MKITFPHMGNVYIAIKGVLEDLNQEVILPPRCSKRTLEIGTKYSPESICLPLKINIGNYIESIEKGADTIIIVGSNGPCRFGLYSLLEKNILMDLGYNVDVISFDPPNGNYNLLFKNIEKITGTKNMYQVLKKVNIGKKILKDMDNLMDISNKKRAHAYEKYKVDNRMNSFYQSIEYVHGSNEILNLIDNTIKDISIIEENKEKDCLKVGIIGEIYTIIEPFVNLEIEKKLGHMGVEIEKSLTPYKWVEHHWGKGRLGIGEEVRKIKEAKPYLSTLVGGHGRETVGSAVLYAKKGFDGIIHILPLNCMPEIVAQTILPTVEKDYSVPILTLIVDEMTGEAGYNTRLEAYIDLLKKRREHANDKGILYGS